MTVVFFEKFMVRNSYSTLYLYFTFRFNDSLSTDVTVELFKQVIEGEINRKKKQKDHIRKFRNRISETGNRLTGWQLINLCSWHFLFYDIYVWLSFWNCTFLNKISFSKLMLRQLFRSSMTLNYKCWHILMHFIIIYLIAPSFIINPPFSQNSTFGLLTHITY